MHAERGGAGAHRPVPPDPTGGKRALVLCGGGLTGLAYEIGALRALDDVLVGASVNDFDIYVGTSAGALIGALLAAGVTPTEMALALDGTNPELAPPGRWEIYRPNISEAINRMLKFPGVVSQMALELGRHPSGLGRLDIAAMLGPLLPSGIFDSSNLVAYMHRLLTADGKFGDDFRKLRADLHVVACALDTGQRTVFSRFRNSHVPISVAVAASSAVPMLFKPVRIDDVDYVDGGMKGISAIDIAVDHGATLVVVINAVVPLDGRNLTPSPRMQRQGGGTRIADLGLRAVSNQVVRGILHDGLLDHIRVVRDRRPNVDILLIEPRPNDEKMFFHELFSFSARLMVMQHGYESVSNGLSGSWGHVRRILPKHGIHITRRIIDRKPATMPVASFDRPTLLARMMRQTVFARKPRVQLVDDTDADEPAAHA